MEEFTFFKLKDSELMVKIEKLCDQEFFHLVNSKFAPIFEDYGCFRKPPISVAYLFG